MTGPGGYFAGGGADEDQVIGGDDRDALVGGSGADELRALDGHEPPETSASSSSDS